MLKMPKPSLALLALLTALVIPPASALREKSLPLMAQTPPEPTPTFNAPQSLAAGTTLRIDGADTMTTINQSLKQGFEAAYPGTAVELNSSGTDAALQALLAGNLDLVAIGRPLTDAEIAQGLTEVPISREKIAVIVGQNNPFQGDLTFDEFAQIFRGEITNWSELGGPNQPIRFIDRPAISDTRRALSDYDVFKAAPFEPGANSTTVAEDSTAAIVRELGSDGISYAIASQVLNQENVRTLTMHSTEPSDPRYPYSQPRGYVYRGEPSIPVEAFLGYATNPDGQLAVAEAKEAEAVTVATADILPGNVAIAPSGDFMVRGTEAGQLEWLDAQGQPTGLVIPAHTGLITSVVISPDGQTIYSSGADGTIRRWDPQGNALGDPIQGSDGPITDLAISPDGQQLVSGNNDGTVQRWAADGTAQGEPVPAHEGSVRTITFGPDGQTVISGDSEGTLQVFNPDGTPGIKTANAHKGGVTAIAVTPDKQTVITGGADGTLRFWDGAGNPLNEPIAAHEGAVTTLAVSPDNQTIASAGQDQLLKLWDRNGNPKEISDNTLAAPVSSLSFKPNGELVAALTTGPVDVRNPEGSAVAATGVATTSNNGLPTEGDPWESVLALWRQLPDPLLWVPAAVAALLVLTGILWWLLGGRKHDKDESLAGADEGGDAIPLVPVGDTSDPANDDDWTEGLPSSGVIEPIEEPVGGSPDRLAQAKTNLAEGKQLAREGRYDAALDAFNRAIESAEIERVKAATTGVALGGVTAILAQALAGRGSVLTVLGRSDAALVSLNQALETDANSLDAWIGKGMVLSQMGRLDEALFCFDQALELDPQAARAWAGKGQTLMQMGRQQEAQTCLNRAAELGGVDGMGLPLPLPDPAATPGLGRGSGNISITPMPIPDKPSPEAQGPDVPVELQQAIENLPNEGSQILSAAGTGQGAPLPPELQAVVEQLPDLPDQPEAVDDSEGTPTASPGDNAVPLPSPMPPEAVTLPDPEELDEVISALQVSVPIEASAGLPPGAAPTPPATSDNGAAGSTPITPGPAPSSPATGTGDSPSQAGRQPSDNTQAYLADLPPDVLAALQGIPTDSPDSFGLVAAATAAAPPPPPNNPRLTEPSGAAGPTADLPRSATQSSIKLSAQVENDRLYAVWFIADADRAAVKGRGGESLAVRLYDVTGRAADAPLPTPIDEQECYELAHDWFLALPACDRIYVAAIGYLDRQRTWLPLAQSEPLSVICE